MLICSLASQVSALIRIGLRAGPTDTFETWAEYAFGDLTQSGQVRAAVLATVLPSLVIADQCELEGRFLIVHGKLRTYKIHLGSANIQMAPNDQYLCIVPGRGLSDSTPAVGNIALPFEG